MIGEAPIPQLDGRRVVLRPITPDDYNGLYASEVLRLGGRWRLRGETPDRGTWVASLYEGVASQFLVLDRSTQQAVGWVILHDVDRHDRVGHLAVAGFAPAGPQPLVIEGLALFVEHCFRHFDLRKLYGEVPAFNLAPFAGMLGGVIKEEGRLIERRFLDGRHWDVHVLSIERTRWDQLAACWLPSFADRAADASAERDPSPETGDLIADLRAACDIADSVPIGPQSRLVDDLGLDSLHLVMVLAVYADHAGEELPSGIDLLDATVGDLMHHAESARSRAASSAPVVSVVVGRRSAS